MDLFPAIDLRGGRCVRLHQGDYAQETVYAGDPVAVAREFAADGARWLHVVDLDAARTGRADNRELILAIAAAVPTIRVEASGGIRDDFSASALLDSGVDRICIGTAAIEDPAFLRRVCKRHPGRVAVGLDTRGGEVAIHGWTAGTGRKLLDTVHAMEDAGAAAFVVTTIERDATLKGPDVETMEALLAATEAPIVASGGVGALEHLADLARLAVDGRDLAGAIVGKAIYEGKFSVLDALATIEVARNGSPS